MNRTWNFYIGPVFVTIDANVRSVGFGGHIYFGKTAIDATFDLPFATLYLHY